MSLYNAFLGRGPALAQIIRKLTTASVDQVQPELAFEVDLEGRPEYRYLAGDSLCGKAVTQAGGVGTQAWVTLANPAGSNLLVVLERANFIATANVAVRLSINSSLDVIGSNAGCKLDTRYNPTLGVNTPASFAVIYQGPDSGTQVTAAGTPVEFVSILANTTGIFSVALPLVLAPGRAVNFVAQTSNVQLQLAMAWLERPLFEMER